jgi:hypothetical protein
MAQPPLLRSPRVLGPAWGFPCPSTGISFQSFAAVRNGLSRPPASICRSSRSILAGLLELKAGAGWADEDLGLQACTVSSMFSSDSMLTSMSMKVSHNFVRGNT